MCSKRRWSRLRSASRARPYSEVMPGSRSTSRFRIHSSRSRGSPLRRSIGTAGSLYALLVS